MILNRYSLLINLQIKVARLIFRISPFAGKVYSFFFDPFCLFLLGIDMTSYTVNIKKLSIAHPVGILLGGNGIVSSGTVIISSGVKFVGKSPADPAYLRKHASKSVFTLGTNVFIGAGCVLVGPLSICDNVIIGAMSLVTKSIDVPGTYVGNPLRRISDSCDSSWFQV